MPLSYPQVCIRVFAGRQSPYYQVITFTLFYLFFCDNKRFRGLSVLDYHSIEVDLLPCTYKELILSLQENNLYLIILIFKYIYTYIYILYIDNYTLMITMYDSFYI